MNENNCCSHPSYIIVSPCKNEEKNLLNLAESIVNQTLKTKLWVIYDDGSTDNTPHILNELVQKYDWIYVINGCEHKRDLSFHYAEIVNKAINCAFEISNKRNIHFDYVGLIDMDMILELNFFEKILEKFKNNEKLGIAGGGLAYKKGDQIIVEKVKDDLPIGGLRVWRKECLIETGVYPRSYSADSVSNVLAKLHGWETTTFSDIIGIQTRKTSSAEGLWKGFKTRGESDYYRDYHPLYVFFKFIKYIFSYPFYTGFGYSYGYITSVLMKRNKITLPEVRKYYRHRHMKILNYYIKKIRL